MGGVACFSAHVSVHLSVIFAFPSVYMFLAVPEMFISSSWVPVTLRGCVIRGTVRPPGSAQ